LPPTHPWRELLLAYLCLVLSNSVLYAGPVCRAAAATAMGWSQEAVTGAFALGFPVVIPVPFFAGWAADRWGASLVARFATFTDLFAGPWLLAWRGPGHFRGCRLDRSRGRFRTLYTAAAVAALLWAILSVILARVPRFSTPRPRCRRLGRRSGGTVSVGKKRCL
jgi:hypothetical protein